MASIGAVTVTTMVGAPTSSALEADAFARPGSDRIDRRQVGNRPMPALIETTTLITGGGLAAAADAARKARRALQGTLQTVTDAHGTVHANTFIAVVDVAPGRAIIHEGAAAIQISTQWTVEGA